MVINYDLITQKPLSKTHKPLILINLNNISNNFSIFLNFFMNDLYDANFPSNNEFCKIFVFVTVLFIWMAKKFVPTNIWGKIRYGHGTDNLMDIG
jgi:hypothetical protein